MKTAVPDTSPAERQGWKWRVHHAIVALTLGLGLTFSAMLFELPLVGKLAWASDVDKKIAAAVDPLKTEVQDLKSAVNEQNTISKAFLAKLAEDSLVYTFDRMCKEEPYSESWRRLNSDYVRFRSDYAKATGREYREMRCNERETR